MNILEFINYTKQNPHLFIQYCEIIIDPNGCIIICKPSHTETAIRCAAKISNKTVQQIKDEIPISCSPLEWCVDKYGLIAVWYNGYIYSNYKKSPNRFQKRSIDLLLKNNLIENGFKIGTTEYLLYLKRKSIGMEE